MRIKLGKKESGQENIFWITMTDLMLGLVLVFVVLFFYVYLQSVYEKIMYEAAQNDAYETLDKSLKELDISANVDSITGIVKISDLELFELNSFELSEKGKKYLDKFAPAYLDSIFSNEYLDKNIEKIIVQGHTDSQAFRGGGGLTDDEQYMKNMDLSLKRALVVADYMMNTPYNKTNGSRLRKMLIVEGASFSSPVMTDGKEDYDKSRRVELKVIMKEIERKP